MMQSAIPNKRGDLSQAAMVELREMTRGACVDIANGRDVMAIPKAVRKWVAEDRVYTGRALLLAMGSGG
ncbi:hypothetical protein N7468_005398 [Penicillium chermesinum]|uniref:Uncharacterized protein n=1 Tax=Penicillium chermesinum TaxID=63820 RepID=A0A9W9NZ83_9EURO|nr:uncharacterized protein N7468_005398 [Penicillium chermesinum]KAJ5232442.1 hypothetical protein N7468_005398 [Penicillium chermesinum]